jgi:cytochrome c
MRSMSRLLLAAAATLSLSSAAYAGHATSVQAQAMLAKAVAELNSAGSEKALAEFNDQHGAFKTSELYVFVFDMKGTYEAYGANPKLVGTNAIDLKDVEGKTIVRDMIEIAKTQGHGQISYIWLNRADNRVEHKRSVVQRVGDHVVGVGYYAG